MKQQKAIYCRGKLSIGKFLKEISFVFFAFISDKPYYSTTMNNKLCGKNCYIVLVIFFTNAFTLFNPCLGKLYHR